MDTMCSMTGFKNLLMGQDISIEDDSESIMDLQKILECQGQILNIEVDNSAQKQILRASILEKKTLPYQRLRTDNGTPFIQRQDDVSWKADNVIRYIDGFPLPSNTDELNTFDSQVFKDNIRTVDVQLIPKSQRTKSTPNLTVLRSRFQKLQLHAKLSAPSKPKFLDKLFSNVGLIKKSQRKLRNGSVIHTAEIETEEEGEDPKEAVSPSLSEVYPEEVFSDPEPDISPEEEFRDSINSTWSIPNSPKVCGIVQQRLLDFQKLSQGCRCRSLSTPSSPHFMRKTPSRGRERLASNTKNDNPVSFYCQGLARDDSFRKKVMQKGYVKALVDQIDKKDDIEHGEEVVLPTKEEAKQEQEDLISSEPNVKPSEIARKEKEKSPSPTIKSNNPSSNSVGKRSAYSTRTTESTSSEVCFIRRGGKFGNVGNDNERSSSESNSDIVKDDTSEKVQTRDITNPAQEIVKEDEVLYTVPVNIDAESSRMLSDNKCNLQSNIYSNVNVSSASVCNTSTSNVSLKSGYSLSENSDSAIYSNVSGPQSNRTSNGIGTDVESGITSDCTSNVGITAAELFDSSWSDSEHSFDEFSDYDSEYKEDECDKLDTGVEECKLKKICNELLYTEKTYVKKLHLLDEIFRKRVEEENEKEKFFPSDVPKQMFSNITSIHQFHKNFLLQQLEGRMKNWDSESKIGDLMKTNAPFLKMYSDYVKNFDHAMDLINSWMEKSSKFAHLIKEIQQMPECCCLTLQHHMLDPIQRVPRYEMLLKDYIKHLPEDAEDRQDAKAALEKVTEAAQHSNEAMKKIEKFQKLLQIKEKLDTRIDLISPTRELVMEGRVKKISARGRERQDRYLFLFNDLLLICCELLLGSYKVKTEIEMDGLEIMERTDKCVRWILEGENMDIPNTFYVKSRQKIIQLLDETSNGESGQWCKTIKAVIKDFKSKKQSLGGDQPPESAGDVSKADLGMVAPRWIKDDEVTMCMSCGYHFTAFRRRHHCRACGMVICGKCSSKKVPLVYDSNQMNRVCDKCYPILKHDDKNGVKEKSNSMKGRKILRRKANEPSVLSGYLQRSTDQGKTWCKRWFVVSNEFALYEFKAHQDICALSALPLPGYSVNKDIENMDNVFSLYHHQKRDKITYFKTDSQDSKERWAEVMSKTTQLQLPDENTNNRHSTHSSSSSNEGGSNNYDLQQADTMVASEEPRL